MDHFLENVSPANRPQLARLCETISAHGAMAVAFSGGVDSGLLAYVAHRVLGDRSRAVIGVSASLAAGESDAAEEFLREHDIPYMRVETFEGDNPDYRANAGDRCFFCKDELFERIRSAVDATAFPVIAHGANTDDAGDYRPGEQAAQRHGVAAPLAEAGFDKATVRAVACELGLSLWDKPAAPCLASRIPHHSEVTPEKLAQVERAEAVLHAKGFRECRVRHFGDVARVEVPPADVDRLRAEPLWSEVANQIASVGFKTVEYEPDGLRSGRLNDALGRGPSA